MSSKGVSLLKMPAGSIWKSCVGRKGSAVRAATGRGVAHERGPSAMPFLRIKQSLTAETIFEGTRKPLLMWFRAIWWVVGQKNGASAKGIQQTLELGSYQTAWTWLHKLREQWSDRDETASMA